MKGIGTMIVFIVLLVTCLATCQYMDSKLDPYEEGMHFDYSIRYENGFVYKRINGSYIQVLNSDGTPLKCGKKIY